MENENTLNSENQDVEKSLFDAEQFLTDFSNLREECERLKAETQNLQLRIQQLTQDLNNSQCEKQNIERRYQNEVLTQKELIWNLKLALQKSQEERLSWKEKFLDACLKSSQGGDSNDTNVSSSIQKIKSEKMKVASKKKNLKRKHAAMSKAARKVKHKVQAPEDIAKEDASEKPCQATEKNNGNKGDTESTEQPTVIEEIQNEVTVAETTSSSSNIEQNHPTPMDGNSDNIIATIEEVDSSDMGMDDTCKLGDESSHDVPPEPQEFYNIPATFEISADGQPETTFILQTSDATYCATAVLNENDVKQTTSNSFTAIQGSNPSELQGEQSASDSDELTEFNFRCNMCNYVYSDKESLKKHMKAKHTIKTFCCRECNKIYSTKSSLAQHVHHYHRHPNKYKCSVCEKTFHRKDFLIKHETTHNNKRDFACPHCPKRFKTKASLSGHVNGSHNEKRRYVCDFCGMRTSWRLSHLEHVKLHTGELRNSMKRKQAQQMKQDQEQVQQLSEIQYVTPGTVVQFISAE